MHEIMQLLLSTRNLLDKSVFAHLCLVVEAMLSMTGRVTMLGISRWTESGGSYRTIQRFMDTASIPWEKMNWMIVKPLLSDKDDVLLLAGDETVTTKSGKDTFGLGRFFLPFKGK